VLQPTMPPPMMTTRAWVGNASIMILRLGFFVVWGIFRP